MLCPKCPGMFVSPYCQPLVVWSRLWPTIFFYLFVMVTIAATAAQRCDVAMIIDTEKPRDTLIIQVSIRLRRQYNKQDARHDCLQLGREKANIIRRVVKMDVFSFNLRNTCQ
ncbi:hypothetical protein F5Y04DRAFT_250529 [Hypomontagnella monticulosa]|nr:hypothetical protein F5Y04DRAFT_250529 [Hypomontagnella monticulosa]